VANQLKDLLEQLGVQQVDLLGYSMGGRLALTFALLFPNKVRRLILASTSPGLATEKERDLRRIKDAELAKVIVEKGVKSFVGYWEEIPLFQTMKRLPMELQQKVREQRLRNSAHGLANSLLAMGTGSQPSWWGQLDQLACDVLLLTGEEDKKFCSIAESMLRELKKGSWVAIKNSGHAIHVEQAEKFGTIVSGFLISN
jgi:2-succinyl-6-hydroxy-2,4-cyclohexadiene-1-carboxylate synthase